MNVNTVITELYRLLSNIIRVGTITSVDLTNYTCRVRTGNNETKPLRWLTTRAGNARTWWAPTVDEGVILLCIGGNLDTAFVLPAIFSDENQPPTLDSNTFFTEFPDGSTVQYDANNGKLTLSGLKNIQIDVNSSVTINAPEKIRFNTPIVECSNHIAFKTFSATGGDGDTGTLTGNIQHQGGELSSNGVVLDSHTHKGVRSGSDNTGGPN